MPKSQKFYIIKSCDPKEALQMAFTERGGYAETALVLCNELRHSASRQVNKKSARFSALRKINKAFILDVSVK